MEFETARQTVAPTHLDFGAAGESCNLYMHIVTIKIHLYMTMCIGRINRNCGLAHVRNAYLHVSYVEMAPYVTADDIAEFV